MEGVRGAAAMMSNVSVEGSCDAAELATPAPRQCFLSRINAREHRQELLFHHPSLGI
jgi:hypothetical protein